MKLARLQWVGVTLLAVLPLAALFGLVGVGTEHAIVSANGLELKVDYPDRLRYRVSDSVSLTLTNSRPEAVHGLAVRFEERYLSAFDGVQFTPEAAALHERFREVELGDLGPGENRRVVVAIQADAYGQHVGRIVAMVGEQPAAEVEVSTLTLP